MAKKKFKHDDLLPDYGPSKTSIKIEMTRLQKLGLALAALSKEQRKGFSLPETLTIAIADYNRFTNHGAKERQGQYIGKIMRQIEDVKPYEERLSILNGDSTLHTAWLHLVERWRSRMIASDEDVSKFIETFPECDIQELRTHVRNCRKEAIEGHPGRSLKLLFKTIKVYIVEPGSVPLPEYAVLTEGFSESKTNLDDTKIEE
ncbi:MAG: DUF615 domain-containing protein [Neisseriaceae bacterium]|nr:DUF615 domain-containing protein [Neisseriaceae bacterium]